MTNDPADQDRRRFLRDALSHFPTGVIAVCAQIEGEPVGIPVNSFTSVSLEPPLVSISVANTSTTWPRLARASEIGLSILGSGHASFCKTLATRQAQNKFDDVDWTAEGDAVFIEGSAVWLTCRVNATFNGGDHEIILLDIISEHVFPEVEPLIFYRSDMRPMS